MIPLAVSATGAGAAVTATARATVTATGRAAATAASGFDWHRALAWRSWPADLIVSYLAGVMPLQGRHRYLQLRAHGVDGARVAGYRRSITRAWLLAGVALLAAAACGLSPSELGLRASHRLAGEALALVPTVALGVGVTVVLRHRTRLRDRLLRPAAALLPRTRVERRWFVGVALTAGVAEEIVFRGFLLHLLVQDGLSPPVAVVVQATLFGFAHLYQGPVGVVGTGVVGGVLGQLTVSSGLVLPIVLHALVDLRVLGLLPTEAMARPASPPPPAPVEDAPPADRLADPERLAPEGHAQT